MKEETDIKITQHKEKKKYGETENKTRQRAQFCDFCKMNIYTAVLGVTKPRSIVYVIAIISKDAAAFKILLRRTKTNLWRYIMYFE